MLRFTINSADLARIRFMTDAVWETAASLQARSWPDGHRMHHPFTQRIAALDRHDESLGDLRLLLDLTAPRLWVPDTLSPLPVSKVSPRTRLGAVAQTSPEVLDADLATLRTLDPDAFIQTVPRAELAERIAAALIEYWTTYLAPLWPRIEAITAGDLSHRIDVLGKHGIATMLGDLNRRLSYSDHEIYLNFRMDAHIESRGQGIIFVPSVFRFPSMLASWDSAVPVLSYGARGAGRLWETAQPTDLSPLAGILGRTRAELLTVLDVPQTTTFLAKTLDLAQATVSEHLSSLVTGGVLARQRDGRRVLYSRTELGERLLHG